MRLSVLAFLVLLLFVAYSHAQDQRLIVRKDPHNPSQFLCDTTYATFTTPKGWQPNRSDKNTYVILTRSDETYPEFTELISIDIGKPVEQTAKETAERFAKQWNGRVAETKVRIDGEEGYRIEIPPDQKTLRPANCLIVMKNGRVFFLIGGAKTNGAMGKTLDELVATWKWKRDNPHGGTSQGD